MNPPSDKTAAARPRSARSKIRRLAENARYDADTVLAIADAALFCHIAFTDEASGVHCIPTACWRLGEHLYIHGSNGSRMLKALQSGREACVSITLIDGLVLARSAFNHSMNYRSLVVYGCFEPVLRQEKARALAQFMERLAPGRQEQVRPGSAKELAATTVLRLSLAEAAAKLRSGPPQDDPADLRRAVWAGVLPLALVAQPPEPDPDCDPAAAAEAPEHVRAWSRRSWAPR